MKILVPDTLKLDLAASGETHEVYVASEPIPDEHLDAEVLVAWRNSPENLADAARRMHRLALVQSLAAGPDAVLAAAFASHVSIASGRSLHDGPVAEHALALTLSLIRRLDLLRNAQLESTWDSKYSLVQSAPETEQLYTLDGASVTIWGFGSIASRLAPMLTALGANVTGVASAAGERFGFPVVSGADMRDVLPMTDVLISLLPATTNTANAFGEKFIRALPKSALFVNVGRGATVDEDALSSALLEGRLRAAALDVTKEEPLLPESSLWTVPNLIITPHVAGNPPRNATGLILKNVQALRSQTELKNLVPR
jgi:phosphoglycerate dehydrogenase-like enzyme